MQERFDPKKQPPITMWQKELTEKTAERESLYREYRTTKEETTAAEKIKRTVKDILKSETPRQAPKKSRSMEL